MKGLVLPVLLACSSVAFAQQPAADAIPKDLVKLLIRGGMMVPGDTFDIVIGLPDGFPPELMPNGSKALISTTSRNSTTVIAEAPELPAGMARYERQLAAAGWKKPETAPMQQRGLMSGPPAQVPSLWCSGDRYASFTVWPRPEGGSLARLSVNTTTSGRASPCQPISERTSRPMMFTDDIDMPSLPPPPGSRARGGGGGGGGLDSYEQHLRLETPLSVPAILQYYRTEIEKHGWTYASQAVADGVGVVRFTLMSARKEPVVAAVFVTQVPGDPPIEVSLRLVKASSRPY